MGRGNMIYDSLDSRRVATLRVELLADAFALVEEFLGYDREYRLFGTSQPGDAYVPMLLRSMHSHWGVSGTNLITLDFHSVSNADVRFAGQWGLSLHAEGVDGALFSFDASLLSTSCQDQYEALRVIMGKPTVAPRVTWDSKPIEFERKPVACECGVDAVGGGAHSHWCPKL